MNALTAEVIMMSTKAHSHDGRRHINISLRGITPLMYSTMHAYHMRSEHEISSLYENKQCFVNNLHRRDIGNML